MYQPAQQGSVSVPQAPASATSLDQPTWNPFGDDNFSKLTAEDLLNKDFTKLADGNFACTHTFQNAVIDVLGYVYIHPVKSKQAVCPHQRFKRFQKFIVPTEMSKNAKIILLCMPKR